MLRIGKVEYKLLSKVGQGLTGKVYQACEVSTNGVMVIKVDTELKIKHEVKMLSRLQSCLCVPRLLRFDARHIVMEKGTETLSQEMKCSMNGTFGKQKGLQIGIEVLRALESVHARGILHGDIKPSNFIRPVISKWDGQIYMIDYGLSQRRNADDKEGGFVGTSLYCSLAIHEKNKLSTMDDLWSALFMIMDMSVQGGLPWREEYKEMKGTKHRRNVMKQRKVSFLHEVSNWREGHRFHDFQKIVRMMMKGDCECEELILELISLSRDIEAICPCVLRKHRLAKAPLDKADTNILNDLERLFRRVFRERVSSMTLRRLLQTQNASAILKRLLRLDNRELRNIDALIKRHLLSK